MRACVRSSNLYRYIYLYFLSKFRWDDNKSHIFNIKRSTTYLLVYRVTEFTLTLFVFSATTFKTRIFGHKYCFATKRKMIF